MQPLLNKTLILLALCCGLTLAAKADTITFVYQGVGSGSINAAAFSAAAFTITAVGDTSSRQTFNGGYTLRHETSSISIAGVGDFVFTTPTRTFVNQRFLISGFSSADNDEVDLFYAPRDLAFSAWDMLSSIGPIVGEGSLLQWGDFPVLTTGGRLLFDEAESPNATFSATVTGQPIPEPATMILLGTGLVALSGIVGRRLQGKEK